MDKDIIAEARERFEACQDATNDQREKMLDDLRFSNPADPQQWPEEVRRFREQSPGGARPCLTFDQTNQFISQVVNHWRQNKAAIKVRPVDSGADIKVAEALEGLVRHIEDVSRADIAYDCALEYAARCGLGYFRIATVVTNEATNEQDIRIQRIADPFTVQLDPDWQEPDGSDAMFGFVESTLTKRAFDRQYPDAEPVDWETDKGGGWFTEKTVRICEYFDLVDKTENILVMSDPLNPDQDMELPEDEYWAMVKEIGFKPPILRTYARKNRRCEWKKLTGREVLESSEFPASYVPLIPVVGSELWIEGKRHLCGMVRPMKDPMRAYNYDRSNYIETVALQSKVPYTAAAEAIEGWEQQWATANRSNDSYIPWNAYGSDGRQLPEPKRQQPPAASVAHMQGAQQAQNDIQASIGMYRANLGAPSNETSGKAITARQEQGDTANFHYADGMARSLRHGGRIIVEMIPRVIDTKRELRILGEDGSTAIVTSDPSQQQAAVMKGAQVASMNPSIGKYDVSVAAGPAFGTRRQEAVEALKEVINGNPQMMALLGDEFVKMMDIPGADKIAKRLAFALPPEIQQAESAEKDGSQSPEVTQVMQQAQQAIDQRDQALQQAQQMLQQMQQEMQQLQQQVADKEGDRQAKLQEASIKASADVRCEELRTQAATCAPMPAESAPAAPAQPHQVQVITGSEQALAEGLSALVEQVSTQNAALAEQSGHLFLALSAISDQLAANNQPEPPERAHIQGRMVRMADGSYSFEAVKNEAAA